MAAKDAAVEKALTMIGIQAMNYATLKCPVDTGRLAGSITSRVEGDTVTIGTNVEYGKYVEFGTSRMGAQPFIGPAATGHGAEYKAIAQSCLSGA